MNTKNTITVIIGFIILLSGLWGDKAGFLPAALASWLVGFGCILFGQALGKILSARLTAKDTELVRKQQIAETDERNIALSNAARAKAFDCMTTVFGALMISFGIMGVDMTLLLIFVAAYLFIHGYAIYIRSKLEKTM